MLDRVKYNLRISKTKWFKEGINRGARSTPLGFNGDTIPPDPIICDYEVTGFESSLLKETVTSALGQDNFLNIIREITDKKFINILIILYKYINRVVMFII